MDISNVRKITNSHEDVRLVSLKNWKNVSQILPRDQAGPYIVAQEGYAPGDLTCRPDEFVLGRSGKWLSTAAFFALPQEQRRSEFIFGTMAEVMKLLAALPGEAAVWQAGDSAQTGGSESGKDELNTLVSTAIKQKPS